MHVQVEVSSGQARCKHSAAAFSFSPGLMEVTLFGGCPEWPSNFKGDADLPQIAKTTVLRFGESTSTVSMVWLTRFSERQGAMNIV